MILTPGAWIIYGGKMRFTSPPTGDASFPYISKNYALDSGTLEAKPQFVADTDEFLLIDTNTAKRRRVITIGLVRLRREMKKLNFAGDTEAFTKSLDEYASKDAGTKLITYGGGYFSC